MQKDNLLQIGQVIYHDGKEWLVAETKWSGGGTGHGPHDVYPDGYLLVLFELENDAVKDGGETLTKYQKDTGCFTESCYLDRYTVLDKTFTKEVKFVKNKRAG